WRRATTPSGWMLPARERWHWAPARTARSRRSLGMLRTGSRASRNNPACCTRTSAVLATIPRVVEDPRKLLRGGGFWIRLQGMIRGGFLSAKERADLTALARNGLAEHRVARRANAVLLLDKGWSCQKVAEALLLDDDTVREWRDLFATSGVEGLSRFELGGGVSSLSEAQEAQLKAWIVETLPRTTRVIGAFIRREFGVEYESRSGLIKLLHRLGLEYQKPEVIGRHLDE